MAVRNIYAAIQYHFTRDLARGEADSSQLWAD